MQKNLITHYLQLLINAKIYSPTRELRLILAHILGVTYEEIFMLDNEITLSMQQKFLLEQLVSRRCQQEPLAKILHFKEFWARNFYTNQYTLDPRPDSETMIEAIINCKIEPKNILELGVGTGCLIQTLLMYYTGATGVGVDVCPNAIEVAKKNSNDHQLQDRLDLKISNWFASIPEQKFDLIISNPPYIPNNTDLDLSTKYDPAIALYAGEDGIEAYEQIFAKLINFCHSQSMAFLEIGLNQKELVKKIGENNNFKLINTYKDLAGIVRILQFSLN